MKIILFLLIFQFQNSRFSLSDPPHYDLPYPLVSVCFPSMICFPHIMDPSPNSPPAVSGLLSVIPDGSGGPATAWRTLSRNHCEQQHAVPPSVGHTLYPQISISLRVSSRKSIPTQKLFCSSLFCPYRVHHQTALCEMAPEVDLLGHLHL